MRKDVKLVVAAACLLLVGLLGYVLFAPSHKKGAVAEEGTESGTTTTSTNTAPSVTTPAPETTPPVSVAVAPPATQPTPAVTVTLGTGPTSQPVTPAGPSTPVVPSTDSNVALAGGPTDWAKTLSTGSVASSSGRSTLASSTLMGTTDTSTSGSTGLLSGAGPSTRPSATGGGKTHKVAFGETLSSIAAEYYGNKASYTKIQAANPTVNANHLKVGTVLNIPDLKASKSDDTGSTTGSTEKAIASSGSSYVVKPGDSLQKIATKLYGSTDKWQKLYDLNRSSIGGDPHRLRAGMTLKLPEAPTTAAAR